MLEQVFSIESQADFERTCLDVFRHQYAHNNIYRQYADYVKKGVEAVHTINEIPFLPIEFFKTQTVYSSSKDPKITFHSSGTTGSLTSKHLVADLNWYEESFKKCFSTFYGDAQDIAILALLPSYLERSGSSLIYMVDDLIHQSNQSESGYFLYNHQDLYQTLLALHEKGTKTILMGVTYALLDFCENYTLNFPELIVMETGGMKGKRKEMIRPELHQILCTGFGVSQIHSEYGMTELLSQGYSTGQGVFRTPQWMKIRIRDTNDPFTYLADGKTGAINVIDLANYNSCAFIATQDLGKHRPDDSFEILGRFDNSDIRGCNLLVQ
ncbi:acyl transferase [Sphingobacterium sp. JB170]|uniref:LuxE/PaaK family acyltransferase n=1 Tax=Sphingobacterium sp. JB170 TaxID=1434842 RepID=UPI000B34BAC8|nr:acyl transferase [Sphingobacterium sp. JB170]